MLFYDQIQWEKWKKACEDPRVVAFAERWAERMEAELKLGRRLQEVAERTRRECKIDELDDGALDEALQVLLYCWKHREALQKWETDRQM